MHSMASCAAWKLGIGIGRRIGRDERQIALEGKLDECVFGCLFDRIVPTDDLDVQPIGKQGLQAIEIKSGLILLAVCQQPRQGAFRTRRQGDQALVGLLKRSEWNVRVELDRTIEVRGRNQVTKVPVALLVLRQQHEPVDAGAARFRRARDGQHSADDRLYALRDARLREGHRSVKTVAVVEGHCRKAKLRRTLRDHFRLHRPFKHREGRENAERNVWMSHRQTMGVPPCIGRLARAVFPQIIWAAGQVGT